MSDIKVCVLIVFDAIFLFTNNIKSKNFSLCTFAFQAIVSYKTDFLPYNLYIASQYCSRTYFTGYDAIRKKQ